MRKIVLFSILTASLMAAQVGEQGIKVEFGGLKTNATAKFNGTKQDADLSTTYEMISYGKYYDFGRVAVFGGIMNKDKGTDGKFMGIGYDYMFYNKSPFVPFIGANIAYSWNEANYDIKHNGLIYGVSTGLVYELTKDVDLEIGARYFKSSIDGSKTVNGAKVQLDVDDVVQYYLSVGYKF